MINRFDGTQYAFLSNFYEPIRLHYFGLDFTNSEAAYQAAKCTTLEEMQKFSKLDANKSKKKGKSVKLRPDWEEVKIRVMREVVMQKFTQNDELRKLLKDTGEEELVEGNWWNDRFWGVCGGVGENWLGKILMETRLLV